MAPTPLYRRPLNEVFGTLSAGITALETTLQSERFVALDDGFNDFVYTPVVLADDTTQTIEIVWLYKHAAGSNTVSVLRGREGTTARQWPAGTTFRVAPTARDAVPGQYRSQYGSPHVGMHLADPDAQLEHFYTASQGWIAQLGNRRPKVATDAYDAALAASHVPMVLAGHCNAAVSTGTGTSVSPSAGAAFWDLGAPPPNNIIAVLTTKLFPTVSDSAFARADLWGVEKSTDNWRLWFACVDGGNALLAAGKRVNFSVLAVVY